MPIQPNVSLQCPRMAEMDTAQSTVGHTMSYFTLWQSQLPSSLWMLCRFVPLKMILRRGLTRVRLAFPLQLSVKGVIAVKGQSFEMRFTASLLGSTLHFLLKSNPVSPPKGKHLEANDGMTMDSRESTSWCMFCPSLRSAARRTVQHHVSHFSFQVQRCHHLDLILAIMNKIRPSWHCLHLRIQVTCQCKMISHVEGHTRCFPSQYALLMDQFANYTPGICSTRNHPQLTWVTPWHMRPKPFQKEQQRHCSMSGNWIFGNLLDSGLIFKCVSKINVSNYTNKDN